MVTKSKPAVAAKRKAVVAKPARTLPTTSKRAKVVAAPIRVETPKKREKLVRDGFTIPKGEYAALADLKQRAAKLGQAAKKSELLRAGIKLLTELADTRFVSALLAVPTIKTGRPRVTEPLAATAAATPKPVSKTTPKPGPTKKVATRKPAPRKVAVRKKA